jgi:MFS transporter, PPP family, 3-phenylpropionic acid transporter
MRSLKPTTIPDRFALWLALFYGGVFVAGGIQMPFFPVWLAAKGLDPRAIGVILAVPMAVRVVAVLAVTRVADRREALRGALIATAVATAFSWVLIGFADGFGAILLATIVASAAYSPVLPLTDTYALKGLGARRRAYGPVRLWGSAAFIAGNLGAGLLVDVIAPRDLVWLIVAAFGAAALASVFLTPLGTEPPARTEPHPSASVLLRRPGFLAVVAAASFVQASHAVYYGFSTLAWTAMGLDGATVGGLWALGVIAEIVLFRFSARLPPGLGPALLIAIGAAGAVVRWLAMAFDPPLALLPVLQVLHGLSFGATFLGALQYLARTTPEGLGATAQGYLSIAQGLAMAAAMGLSGMLFGALGSLAYGAMAALAALGGILALAAHRLSRPEPAA